MVGLPEVLMMSAVVLQAALVVAIAYGGVRLMRRYTSSGPHIEPPSRKPIGL